MSRDRHIATEILVQDLDTISISIEEAKDADVTISQVASILDHEDIEGDDRRELSLEELGASEEDRNRIPELADDRQSTSNFNSYGDDALEEAHNDHDWEASSSSNFTKCKRNNTEACLEGLPAELLDEILGLLLVNPELGRSTSISEDDDYGTSAIYGLYPDVLRVSKHLHKRGIAVLYGLNTFYTACLPNRWPLAQNEQIISSPLTRFVSIRFVSVCLRFQSLRVMLTGSSGLKTSSTQLQQKLKACDKYNSSSLLFILPIWTQQSHLGTLSIASELFVESSAEAPPEQ